MEWRHGRGVIGRSFVRNLISRHLGKAYKDAVLPKPAAAAIETPSAVTMLAVLEHPEIALGDNANEKRNQLLLSSLHDAYEDMEKLRGPEPEDVGLGQAPSQLTPTSLLRDRGRRDAGRITSVRWSELAVPLPGKPLQFRPRRISTRQWPIGTHCDRSWKLGRLER